MIGYVLKLIRIANENMTCKEAADKIGIAQSFVAELENGNRNPSQKTLEKISLAYGIPISKILFLDERHDEDNLSYQELLMMILQYYTFEREDCQKIILENSKTPKIRRRRK